MKPYLVIVFLCASMGIALFGCGGGGGGDATYTLPVVYSSGYYAGAYEGNWFTASQQGGTIYAVIASNGTITGNIRNTSTNSYDPAITGTCDSQGNINILYNYPGNPTGRVTGTIRGINIGANDYHVSGTLIVGGSGDSFSAVVFKTL